MWSCILVSDRSYSEVVGVDGLWLNTCKSTSSQTSLTSDDTRKNLAHFVPFSSWKLCLEVKTESREVSLRVTSLEPTAPVWVPVNRGQLLAACPAERSVFGSQSCWDESGHFFTSSAVICISAEYNRQTLLHNDSVALWFPGLKLPAAHYGAYSHTKAVLFKVLSTDPKSSKFPL